MDERDKEMNEMRREIARLRKELAESKRIQYELFKRVPADLIVDLMRDTPEKLQ